MSQGRGFLYELRRRHVVRENDQAIALLQNLMSIPAGLSVSSALLRADPFWDPLRADPRFDALVKQGGGNVPHG
jgi:hypothetical protein